MLTRRNKAHLLLHTKTKKYAGSESCSRPLHHKTYTDSWGRNFT